MGVGFTQFKALHASRSSSERDNSSNLVTVSVIEFYSGSILSTMYFNIINKMRKTIIYWQESQIQLLQAEKQRLKVLSATYPELILSPTIPTHFNPRSDYIRLTNSQAFPQNHLNLISTIVYCLKLNDNKRRQIELRFSAEKVTVFITNDYNTILNQIIKCLGYSTQETEKNESVGNRFVLDKKINKPDQQLIKQRHLLKQCRYVAKLFGLDFDVEKTPLEKVKLMLERELKQFMKQKNMLILQKEFNYIHRAENLQELCRACFYFYSLQKYPLYKHLNLILKNIRSVTFQKQFENLKLLAFMLILNYFYVYFNNQIDTPHILYRFTNTPIDQELLGQVVTVPSFYSVSQIQLQQFKKQSVKIIIYPLAQTNQISLRSVFPIYQFSAFKKQKEYLYIPFTSFKIIHLKKTKTQTIVHMKEVPGNPLITQILNNNLRINCSYSTVKEQEMSFQLKYQFHQKINVRMKVAFNLGLIHEKYSQRIDIAKQYLLKAVQLSKELKNNIKLSKAYNHLGLIMGKMNKFQQAKNYFKQCFNLLKKIPKSDKNIYRQAALLNNQGNLLQKQGHYELAMNKFNQSLILLKECQLSNQLLEACIHNNIGRCQMELNLPKQQTLKTLMKSIDIYKEVFGNCEHIPQLVVSYENISEVYERNGCLKESIENEINAIQLYQQVNEVDQDESLTLMYMKIRLAKLLNKTQNYQESVRYYQQALKVSKIVNDNGRTSASLKSNIASVLINKGGKENYFQAIKRYEEAIQYLTKPLLSQNLDLYDQIANMKGQLIQCLKIYE